MTSLKYGRFEAIRILRGELVLDPWPSSVRSVKFGSTDPAAIDPLAAEYELKRQACEFFEYVRAIDAGEIRCLEVRHGLPFSMEIEHRPEIAECRHE